MYQSQASSTRSLPDANHVRSHGEEDPLLLMQTIQIPNSSDSSSSEEGTLDSQWTRNTTEAAMESSLQATFAEHTVQEMQQILDYYQHKQNSMNEEEGGDDESVSLANNSLFHWQDEDEEDKENGPLSPSPSKLVSPSKKAYYAVTPETVASYNDDWRDPASPQSDFILRQRRHVVQPYGSLQEMVPTIGKSSPATSSEEEEEEEWTTFLEDAFTPWIDLIQRCIYAVRDVHSIMKLHFGPSIANLWLLVMVVALILLARWIEDLLSRLVHNTRASALGSC